MGQLRFKKVAVLYGGHSAERPVSLKSGAAVTAALQRSGFSAEALDTQSYNVANLRRDGFDVAFIMLHGRGGEDGVMQGALELLGIPYTGSRVLGSALSMDKIRTKQIWQAHGLPTAQYRTVIREQGFDAVQVMSDLGGKAMVKPSHEGSSIGMAIVTNADELKVAVEKAFEFDSEVLVEQWSNGDEFTVAVLGQQELPPVRMSTSHAFYDYDAKYQANDTQYFCPCGLPSAEEHQLQQYAQQAFAAVGAYAWGRVDAMRCRDTGAWFLLEVNTVPGMTEKSLVPMAAKASGLSFEQLVVNILHQAQ